MFITSDDLEMQIKELCYDILSYNFAEEEFKKLRHPIQEYWCVFENDFKEIYNRKFYPKLIMLSSIIRVLIDNNEVENSIKEELGYKINQSTNGKEELNLKECCNKIIHGEKINIKLEMESNHPLGYPQWEEGKTFKNIIIEVEDDYRGVSYTSKIYLIKFITEIMYFIKREYLTLTKK